MSVAGKIAALFAALTQDDLDAMPPAERPLTELEAAANNRQ